MNKKCNEILNKLEAEGKIKILKDFSFPEPIELKLRLKDMLEDEVDEKFYLKDEIVNRFVLKDSTLTKNIIGTTKPKSRTIGQRDLVYNPNAIIGTLTSTDYKQPKQILQIGTLDIKGNDQIRRVYGVDGVSPTLSTMQGGNTQPKILEETNKIIKLDIPKIVKIRKYNVDVEGLKKVLRDRKKAVNLSNKQIAYILNEPLTKVEHWFRNDKCFSIPDADVWESIKNILDIDTDKFDESITTFIEVEGKFEKANRVYITSGIAPTVTTQEGEKILEYPIIAASRGRYNSDGTTSQKLEINNTGTTNTITSVQKYNYVLENKFRIRKLTPKECWRLMGFKDYQFERAAKVCSNTQLYKQAGNSIVIPVLEGIFENLRYIFER